VENAEKRRLIEWIEENGWEVLNRNKQRDEEGGWTYVGSRGGNSDRLRNSERRSLGKSRRIKNRRESRVGPSRSSFEEEKGKERREKKRVEIGIKLFIFIFLE
jgi:hypothetical protein